MNSALVHSLNLTLIQALLLDALMQKAIATHDDLMKAGWGTRIIGDDTIKVHICKLRAKLTPLGVTLDSIHRRGYALGETSKEILRGLASCSLTS